MNQTRSSPDHKRALLAWVECAGQQLAGSRWAPALHYRGIDVPDLLVSGTYRAFLAEAERTMVHASPLQRSLDWGRWIGYRARMVSASARATGDSRLEPGGVVFWPRHVNHLGGQLPLARALTDVGHATTFVSATPPVLAALATAGVPALNLERALAAPLWRARAEATWLSRVLFRDPAVSIDPCPAAIDGARAIGIFRATWLKQLQQAYETIRTAEAVTGARGTNALVVGDDLTQEGRGVCRLATRRGIPTVALMHGMVVGSVVQRLHCVDRFLVFGDADRRALLQVGVGAEQVQAVGAPHLDQLPVQTGRAHPRIAARLGLDRDSPWALWTTSGPGLTMSMPNHLDCIEHVMRLSATMPEVRFVAKLHHQDSPRHFDAVRARVPGERLLVVPAGLPDLPRPIFDWLQGCPLLLVNASTVAVEAMSMGVPVVSMDFRGDLAELGFVVAGATLHATTAEQLAAHIRTVLTSADPSHTARVSGYLRDTFSARGARAAANAAQVVADLIKRRQAA